MWGTSFVLNFAAAPNLTSRLLAVQGPLQFIAGYVAMEWCRKLRHESEASMSVLLLYDFLMPDAIEAEFVEVITQLAALHQWRAVVFISRADMAAMMRGSYSKSIRRLHRAIGSSSFDEIYLARDFCGDGSPLIVNAYPKSTRVTYGDGLGIVGNEAELGIDEFDWKSPVRSLYYRCRSDLKTLLFGGPRRFTFDAAVLALPQVWSETYLDHVPLMVPDKQFVVSTVNAVYANLTDLRGYCHSLLKHNSQGNIYLYPLSNLSGSGLMSDENEIALYLEIIRETAPRDAFVLLKGHPRSSRYVLNTVVAHLETEYRVEVIDDVKLSRFPLELWVDLIQSCTVVPMFSASALNLKYLYDKEVVLPLNGDRISRYFYNHKMSYVSKAHSAISQSVARLATWDGKSVLWKGAP